LAPHSRHEHPLRQQPQAFWIRRGFCYLSTMRLSPGSEIGCGLRRIPRAGPGDAEIDAVMTASWPLLPAQREAFEKECIWKLQQVPMADRGPGLVHRIIAQAQKDYPRSTVCRQNISDLGLAI
jgi:hypothetical protein